jgi:hypothetical protein
MQSYPLAKSLLSVEALQQDEVSNDMGSSHIAALADNTAPNDACKLWIKQRPRSRHVKGVAI